MIKQDCIPLEASTEWKDALNGIKHSFGHTWENCYAQYLTTGFKTYLYCFESEHGRIVCPIAEREYGGFIDIVKPFGFSGFVGNGDCDEFRHYWQEFVRQKGYICGYLGLDPIFDFSYHFSSNEIYHYDNVYILDLTISQDELFANLSRSRRRKLKDWDKIMFNLVFDKPVLIDFFLTHYIDYFRRKNAPSFYFLSQETLLFLFSLDNVLMVGVRDSEQIVAVCVYTYTNYIGENFMAVSLPEGQHYSSSLVWYRVNHLKSLQVPLLNLGGGGSSLAVFKRQFGGNEFALKCLKQVYEPEIYQKLCREANADPIDMVGYFPGYRKP